MSQTIITARIYDQSIQLVNLPLIASGSEGALAIECSFDSSWEGYGKTAVFYRDEGEVYHVVLVEGVVDVPTEVLTEEGFFHFGIFGSGDNTRTTEVLRVNVVKGAITTATATPTEPSPDIYRQILANYGKMDSRVSELVAMRGSGVTEQVIEGDCFQGVIYSNGAAAFISLEFYDLPLTANNSRIDLCIPPAFAPLGLVTMKSLANSQDAHITISPRAWTGTEWAQIEITAGNEDITDSVEFEGYYDLESVFVPELADARVDADGINHNTAGDAIRSQVENLGRRVTDLEENGTGDGGSSWEVIDKLCPRINESGVKVRCEPVEGYPLSVTAEEGATTISRAGKNLIDYNQAVPRTSDQVVNIIDKGVEWAEGNHYFKIPCNIKAGDVVAFSCVDESGAIDGATLYNSVTKSACSDMSRNGNGVTATADADVVYVYKKNPSTQITNPIEITNLQLEFGRVATTYEPYKGIETFAPGEPVPALSGVNTIWADSGGVTVTGRTNPISLFEKLTNAVIALGGNI